MSIFLFIYEKDNYTYFCKNKTLQLLHHELYFKNVKYTL